MLRVGIVLILTSWCNSVASAQGDTPVQADPEKQALAFELQECVGGKVRTATQLFTLKLQLDAATKRADEAESRLKALEEKKQTQ